MLTMINGRWIPVGTERLYRRPQPGEVIALRGRALEVVDVQVEGDEPRDPDPRRDRRAFRLLLRRLYGPKHRFENDRAEFGIGVAAGRYPVWDVYPERMVPLCSCCQHPWPCRNLVALDQSTRAAAQLEERLGKIGPGICFGCGEPITHRQNAIRFYEPNVQVPGAPPPVFHARQSCSGWVASYERTRADLAMTELERQAHDQEHG